MFPSPPKLAEWAAAFAHMSVLRPQVLLGGSWGRGKAHGRDNNCPDCSPASPRLPRHSHPCLRPWHLQASTQNPLNCEDQIPLFNLNINPDLKLAEDIFKQVDERAREVGKPSYS